MKIKKSHLIIVLLQLMIWTSGFAQFTFFHQYDNIYTGSQIKDIIEYKGMFYASGIAYNKIGNTDYQKQIILKLDAYGNIVNRYEMSDSLFAVSLDKMIISNDTIYAFSCKYLYYGPNPKILFQKFDLSLNLLSTKQYKFPDSTAQYIYNVILDKESNLVMATQTFYFNTNKIDFLLFKISEQGDSLYYSKSIGATDITEDTNNNLYFCSGESPNLFKFNQDLDTVGQILLDTNFNYLHFWSSPQFISNDTIIAHSSKFVSMHNRYYTIGKFDISGMPIKKLDLGIIGGNIPPKSKGIKNKNDLVFSTWQRDSILFDKTKPSTINIAKFDINLNPIWIKEFSNDSFYYNILGLITTADGGCLTYGFIYQIPNGLYNKYFILKVDSMGTCTWIKNIDPNQNLISIYPNPATTEIKIKLESNSNSSKTIRILDVTGKCVQEFKNISFPYSYNIEHLQSGVYFLQIEIDGKVYSEKFVKK